MDFVRIMALVAATKRAGLGLTEKMVVMKPCKRLLC